MKKLILILTAFTLASCGSGDQKPETAETKQAEAQKISITIKGSDTVLPLSQKEAEEYMKEHPEASITIVGGGSGVGITALGEGSTDIAMSSRPLKMDEKLAFKDKNVQEVIVGMDALAVVVHPSNKVKQLTREQIEGIYTGKITNWKDVGGSNLKIVAYSRESSSGTYEFFKEHVMDKKNYASSVLNMPATGAIVQSVSQTEGAVGYVGLAYETKEVTHVAVSYDQGKTYVLPSIPTAQDNTYPVSRPLYYYYSADKAEAVKPFIDYILSEKGQQLVAESGYVPLKK
jgi:phosphate transport system substrate-binding protein